MNETIIVTKLNSSRTKFNSEIKFIVQNVIINANKRSDKLIIQDYNYNHKYVPRVSVKFEQFDE